MAKTPSAPPEHQVLRSVKTAVKTLAPLGLTANTLRPPRREPIAAYAFTVGWHVSELPLMTLGGQLALTARALRKGKWRTTEGKVRLLAQVASAAGLIALHRSAQDSKRVLDDALVSGLGQDYREQAALAGISPLDTPVIRSWTPYPAYLSRRSRMRASGISYGPEGKRNRLDVWATEGIKPGDKAPVLLQIPGGGWVMGGSKDQAYPLMDRLRTAGWVCVPINYRLSPKATWPDHIVDVKRAIAWVKAHIEEYGGDPDFVVITGGSAGGHLSSLAALTANDPQFQPGFEDADTSVAAAVPFYGVYDLLDWDGRGGAKMSVKHLQRMVFKTSPTADAERWRQASPLYRAGSDAPPMMLLHGANDTLVPVDGARRLAARLREVSANPVVYAELPHAQHAFDIYSSLRALYSVRAVEQFLAYVRAEHLLASMADATRG